VALGAVLGLILLIGWGVKRWAPRAAVGRDDSLQVLSRTPIGAKQSIALLRLGRALAFVGITPDRINILRVVEDAEEIAVLSAGARVHKNGQQSKFDRALAGASRPFDGTREGMDIGMREGMQDGRGGRMVASAEAEDMRRLGPPGELQGIMARLWSYRATDIGTTSR